MGSPLISGFILKHKSQKTKQIHKKSPPKSSRTSSKYTAFGKPRADDFWQAPEVNRELSKLRCLENVVRGVYSHPKKTQKSEKPIPIKILKMRYSILFGVTISLVYITITLGAKLSETTRN